MASYERCLVQGCHRGAYTRGVCQSHYQSFVRGPDAAKTYKGKATYDAVRAVIKPAYSAPHTRRVREPDAPDGSRVYTAAPAVEVAPLPLPPVGPWVLPPADPWRGYCGWRVLPSDDYGRHKRRIPGADDQDEINRRTRR